MLYDKYQKAMARIASVIKFIKRFRVAIISILATVIIGTWTGCAVNGLIYIVEDCPQSIVYGEALDFRAKAIFQDVVYEYAGQGIEGWSIESPKRVGTYKVRAKSMRTFGEPTYSKEYVFTIDPKVIDITFVSEEVTYGDKPVLTADLVQGDELYCEWEDEVVSGNTATFKTKAIIIKDKDGNDVTKDWYIAPETIERELALTARAVNLITDSLESVYDGQAHSTDGYTIADGDSLAQGDVCVFTHDTASEAVNVNAEQTPMQNKGAWTITNKDGADVTYLYDIESTWGDLVITQRPITFCTDSATFVWDGQGHKQETYTIKEESDLSAYGIVEGHTCEVVINGIQIDVGKSNNTVSSCLIYDAQGNDVTGNYAKTMELGVLTVNKRALNITVNDNSKVYNGKMLDNNGYVIDELGDGLRDGDILSVEYSDGIINAGTAVCTLTSQTIYNANGGDITENYEINIQEGTLTVYQRPLSVTTGSETFQYDGEGHMGQVYTVSGIPNEESGLIEGHVTEIDKENSVIIEYVGSLENRLAILVKDSAGDMMTDNYQIEYSYEGVLTMTSRPVLLKSASQTRKYNGTALTNEDYTIENEAGYCDLVEGHTLIVFDLPYGTLTFVGETNNTFVLNENSLKVLDSNNKDVTANYIFDTQEGVLKIEPREIIVNTATASWIYDAEYHYNFKDTKAVDEVDNLDDGLGIGDAIEVLTYPQIRDVLWVNDIYNGIVDSIENTQDIVIKNQNGAGDDVTSNYIIDIVFGALTIEPRAVTLHTGTASWIYDDQNHLYINQTRLTLDFDGSEGLAKDHELNILTNTTIRNVVWDDGAVVGIPNEQTIEIISPDDPNVMRNYVIANSFGTLTITPRYVTLTTSTKTWIYNDEEYYETLLTTLLPTEGHVEDGGLVDEQYWNIIGAPTIRDVVWVDGIVGGEVGGIVNKQTIQIMSANGYGNVMNNYVVEECFGMLTVTPRYITLTTGSGEWVYDDNQHENRSDTMVESTAGYVADGGLVTGQYWDIIEAPTIRDVLWKDGIVGGEVDSKTNAQTIEIHSADGNRVVNDNYVIKQEFGTLKVTPRYVTLTTSTNVWVYDDVWHSNTADTTVEATVGHVDDGGLVAGQYWEILSFPEIRDVLWVDGIVGGEVDSIVNEQPIEIYSAENRLVNDNYIIEEAFGTLTVMPRYVTLTTSTNVWVYDDVWHSNTVDTTVEATAGHVEDGDLVAGQYWNILSFPEIRDVRWKDGVVGGEVEAISNYQPIEISSAEGRVVNDNYIIEEVFGTLKVTPRYITLTTGSGEWIYDDQWHSNTEDTTVEATAGYVDDGGIAIGQTWNIITYPELREVVWVDGIVGGEAETISNEQPIYIYSTDYRIVNDNYIIEEIFGTVKVTPRYITLTTGSGEWIYDDENHSNTVDTTVTATVGHDADGGFAPGQDWYVIYTPSIREVVWVDGIVGGEVESISNQVAINIDSVYGYGSVINNYVITQDFGTLMINPRYITLTTGSGEWVYDDEWHSNTEDTTVEATVGYVADGGLVAGQYWNIAYACEIRDVVWKDGIVGGEVEGISNKPMIEIISAYGYGNVIDNYVIEEFLGTLKITPRYITVTTGNGVWDYDGVTHYNDEDTAYTEYVAGTAYGILPGQTFDIESCAGIKNAGYIENWHTIAIISADGARNVIGNYDVTYELGLLQVLPRILIIETAGAQKIYDGTPLTNARVSVDTKSLVEGETLVTELEAIGSQTEIGYSQNYLNVDKYDIVILNAWGENGSSNYDIRLKLGYLVVYEDGEAGGGPIGGNLKDDGDLGGEFEEGDEEEASAPLFSFVIGQDGMVYFRFKSFGDYTFNGWDEAEVYTDAGLTVNPLQFVGLALQNAGYETTEITITDIQGNTYWMLPYYAMDDSGDLNDVVIDKGVWTSYTMDMYLYDYFMDGTVSLIGTEYEAMEQVYRDFVYSQYVSLPASTKAEMQKVIDAQGFSAGSPTIIQDVADFISNYLPYDLYTKNYTGDYAVYFFTEAETALCRYYATAATAVYRTLGIPARYVSGYVAAGLAGREIEVTAMQGHAWVEVYIDGLGWIPVEVTGSGGTPDIPMPPTEGPNEVLPIILRPLDIWEKYTNATPTLTAINQLDTTYIDHGYECLQAYLDQGYTYYVEVSGMQIGLGSSESNIVSFIFYDPDGKDVTDQFEFEFTPGLITLYGDFAVELVSELRITYDGKYHSYYDFELLYQQMGEELVWYTTDVPDGYEITFNSQAIALRDVGTLDVEKLKENMVITLNGVLVTDPEIYEKVEILGKTMRIQRKAIEITTGSYTAEYQEGHKVTTNVVWITKGSLCEGHYLVATTNGQQEEIGKSENTLASCIIVDEDGNDVTDNYDVHLVHGILEVIGSN